MYNIEKADQLHFKYVAVVKYNYFALYMYIMQTPTLDINPIEPSFGPVSGGTKITINGQHLMSGTSHGVEIGGVACQMVRVGSTLSCVTPAGSLGAESVSVSVDKWNGRRGSGFEYVADPTFASVEPMISFAG